MTQAFNLSQLANNVNTSGLLNAAAGLYNQTPVANGGTGVASVASGNLLVGAGTAAMTALAGTNTNDILTWNGSAWVSQASQGSAQAPVLNVYATPGTWTKPATVKGIKVTVVGGGGNGGVGNGLAPAPSSIFRNGGGGGGGGGTSVKIYPAPSLPGPQPYTVGGATASSSFGGTAPVITATGGSTGTNSSGPGTQGIGGAGGAGSSGTLNVSGSQGFPGYAPGTGGSNSVAIGGMGGNTLFGGNATTQAISPGAVGTNGQSYGGGGSGGQGYITPGVNPSPGGTGASGVVIIEEFY